MGEELGKSLGRFVGLDWPATLSTRYLQVAEIAASRARWNEPAGTTPVRMESRDGYLLCLQRRPLLPYQYWVDGKPVPAMPLNSGQFLLLDLNFEHASLTRGHVDCVSMYIPREALRTFSRENGIRFHGHLRAASGVAFSDDVVRNLGETLAFLFDRPEATQRLVADHIGSALLGHLTCVYGDQSIAFRSVRGGLANWQVRRAKEILLANMDGRVGLAELALACGLSRSHFARAFKTTTGVSPLAWLVGQRLERAKSLLLGSDSSLDEIAESCGFADQSHFTRTFLKHEEVTPGRWRRYRRP